VERYLRSASASKNGIAGRWRHQTAKKKKDELSKRRITKAERNIEMAK